MAARTVLAAFAVVALLSLSSFSVADADARVTLRDLSGRWIVAESNCVLDGNVTLAEMDFEIAQAGGSAVLSMLNRADSTSGGRGVYAQLYQGSDGFAHFQIPRIYDRRGRGNCWGQSNANVTVIDGSCRFEGTRSCRFQLACEGKSCSAADRPAPPGTPGDFPTVAGQWQTDLQCECYKTVPDFGYGFMLYQGGAKVLIDPFSWQLGALTGTMTADGSMSAGRAGMPSPVCQIAFSGKSATGHCTLVNDQNVTAPCEVSAKCFQGACAMA